MKPPPFLPCRLLVTGIYFSAALLQAGEMPSPMISKSVSTPAGPWAMVSPSGNLILSGTRMQSISPNGTVLWNIDAAGSGIAMDTEGNIYTTGAAYETPGVFTVADLAVTKVSPAGTVLWTRKTGLPNAWDEGSVVVVDEAGGVYAAGMSKSTSFDLFLVKYNADGVFQWSRRFNGAADLEDKASGLVAMSGGGVVVTGITRNSAEQFVTIRYSATGVPAWVSFYDFPGETEGVPCGGVPTTDGGVAIAGMSGQRTIATVKYAADGSQLWANRTELATDSPSGEGTAARIVAGPGGGAVVLGMVRANTGHHEALISTASDGVTAWHTVFRSAVGGIYPGHALLTALPGGGYAMSTGDSPYHHNIAIDFARLTCVNAAGGSVTSVLTWPEPGPFGGDNYPMALTTGADGSVWATDNLGNLRRFGAVAAEGAPLVTAIGFDNLTNATVRLRASVNPNGSVTTYSYEYGPTTAYGSTTPARQLVAGVTPLDAFEPGVPVTAGTTFHFRVMASNAGGSYVSSDQSFVVPQSAYQAWTVSAFGSLGAPGSGPQEDPEKDGYQNLVEYTFGANPTTSDTPAGIPVFSLWESPESGIVFPSIVYRPDPTRPGVTVTPVASNDLITWTTGGIVVNGLPDGSRRAIAQGLQRFMRLQITSP